VVLVILSTRPKPQPTCEDDDPVKLLRRVLLAQAAVWAACGVAIVIVPHRILHRMFDQPTYPDYTYVRVTGIMSAGLALLMVLVSQRIDELWWWAWAFILMTAGIVTTTGLHALFGGPAGSSPALWWLFAGLNALFLVGLLAGMTAASREKPLA
jgi:hypothetical protein